MKKLVVITSRFPFPLDKGDKLRAYHQIKELAKSMEVHLISVTNSSVPESDKKVLENLCASVTIHKLNKIGLVWSLFKSLFNKKPFQVALFYNKVIHNKISN